MPQRTPTTRTRWQALSTADTFTELGSAPAGLTEAEAGTRREQHGLNRIPVAPPTPWWRVLLSQFVSPLIAILLVAGIVTALQQHWVDTIAIAVTLLINAVIGYWQERKAERDVRALQSLSSTTARVVRDGIARSIDAEELVPGDVVALESGEKVPADVRLTTVNGLQVDESMLTGESKATRKSTDPVGEDAPLGDQLSLAFSGTLVTSGRGRGLVIATGAGTELGAISDLVSGQSPPTPLQVLTHRLERWIGTVVLATIAVIFVTGLAQGFSLSEMFRSAVALAVATIPESLPIVLTVAMSVGVSRMARRGAIVRSLPSVETLGSTTVIASDKTGTLTENRLTVEQLWSSNGFLPARHELDEHTRGILRAGSLTNEAVLGADGAHHGDAVDVAIAELAVTLGAVTPDERAVRALAHTPYEPALRYSQTVRLSSDGTPVLYVKGSPEAVAEMSSELLGAGAWNANMVDEANAMMARDGLRVLAFGMRMLTDSEAATRPLPPPSGLTFLGLVGMADPPRSGVAEAITECVSAGVTVCMVTGDHPTTAQAIARRLGIEGDGPPLTGPELADLTDGELVDRIIHSGVAARVTPHDKLRIVNALSARGETVAVTGDGVNDAPALRAAAIGVAMGKSGTDVAREAADLVLTDDSFSTIVYAIEQGRVTFAAIRKATHFLLSNAVAGVVAVAINVLLDQPLIFLPVQLLWINLVTCGFQDVALAMEPAEGDELTRPPRPRNEGVLSRTLWIRTFVTGVWIGVIVLLVYTWAIGAGVEVDHARTLAMAAFVFFNVFQVGNARTELKSVFTVSPLRNKLLFVSAVGAAVLFWLVTLWPVSANILGVVPLTLTEWVVTATIALSIVVLVETEKAIRARFARSQN